MKQVEKSKNLLLYALFLPVFFASYTLINYLLLKEGFANLFLLFFGEKSLLALKGIPPRLENIGFVYPPLPVYAAYFFNGNVLLAQGFISSLISSYIAVELLKAGHSFLRTLPLIACLVFSFPIVYLATQRFDLYLYFFLILMSMKLLQLYVKTDYSLHIFLAGPLFGLTFFTHFSSLYLVLPFLVMIFLLYKRDISKIVATSIVFFAPYVIFFLIFTYVNWVFTGETFSFLRNYRLLFSNQEPGAAVSSFTIIASLQFMMKYLVYIFPIIIPCIVAMLIDRNIFFLLPFVITLSLIYSNLFFVSVYASAIFIIHFLIMTDFRKRYSAVLFAPLVLISLIYSPILAIESEERHERSYIKAFMGEIENNLEVYKKASAVLGRTEGNILLDDRTGYPIVYLMKAPERFILPYQYEFGPALSNPALFAKYIVAFKDRENDSVYLRFGERIAGYEPVFDNDSITIWKKGE